MQGAPPGTINGGVPVDVDTLPRADTVHIRFDLFRGPVTDNGATPWTASLGLGTPAQWFRFMLDTGTVNTWVTGSACDTDACRHHARFDPAASATYRDSGEPKRSVSFGPWGTMEVLLGGDVLRLTPSSHGGGGDAGANEPLWIYLATHFEGHDFAGLDCDGGLAIPAVDCDRPTALMQQLFREGVITYPLAAFYFDRRRGGGTCVMGAVDPARFDADSVNPLPLRPLEGALDYLWNVPMERLSCGGQAIIEASALVLDTGSSRFKGGRSVVDRLVTAITADGSRPRVVTDPDELVQYPTVSITLGRETYELTPQDYFLETAPAHWELGVHYLEGLPDEMLVVGSVFLDQVYSIFVANPQTGTGQGVILARPVRPRISVSGRWRNEFGSTLEIGPLAPDGTFTGRYRSDTGANGVYPVVGVADPNPEGDSLAMSFSVTWRSLEGPSDPSWHWVSGFTGLVQIDGAGERLHTTYLLQRNVTGQMPDWMATAVYPSVFTRDDSGVA